MLAGTSAAAQGLDSHVHGNAELNVVIAGQQLQFEFISPALNLLGFERAPNSAAEAALLDSVVADLKSSEWLVGDALVDCQMSSVAFETPEFAESHAPDGDAQKHDEDGHDEHAQGTGGDAHANFSVQYLFDCPAPPARDISITAFSHFGGIEEITVQWISETRQGLARLTASNTVLALE